MEVMATAQTGSDQERTAFYEGVAHGLGVRLDPPLLARTTEEREHLFMVLERLRTMPPVDEAEVLSPELLVERYGIAVDDDAA